MWRPPRRLFLSEREHDDLNQVAKTEMMKRSQVLASIEGRTSMTAWVYQRWKSNGEFELFENNFSDRFFFFFLRYLEDCRRSMFESELGFVLDKFCILNITTKIIIFNKCYFYFIWKASRKRENVGQKNITSFSLLSQVHTRAVVETVWSQELGIQPRSFTWMGVSKILE